MKHADDRRRCAACGACHSFPGSLCLACSNTTADDLPEGYQFLTTSPSPYVNPYGVDQGQRGWRLHIVRAHPHETEAQVKDRPALCGLHPAHGWSLDMFIDRPCAPCLRALKRSMQTGGDAARVAADPGRLHGDV